MYKMVLGFQKTATTIVTWDITIVTWAYKYLLN